MLWVRSSLDVIEKTLSLIFLLKKNLATLEVWTTCQFICIISMLACVKCNFELKELSLHKYLCNFGLKLLSRAIFLECFYIQYSLTSLLCFLFDQCALLYTPSSLTACIWQPNQHNLPFNSCLINLLISFVFTIICLLNCFQGYISTLFWNHDWDSFG